jgi:NADH-quinone oxidoreductase subunit I
VSERARR